MPTAMVFTVRPSDQEAKRHENIEAIQAAATMELTGIHQLLSGLAETLASVLTAEGTASKGTGSISCEVEFCTFYRLSQNFTYKGCMIKNVLGLHVQHPLFLSRFNEN
jgi:hypothetical protein